MHVTAELNDVRNERTRSSFFVPHERTRTTQCFSRVWGFGVCRGIVCELGEGIVVVSSKEKRIVVLSLEAVVRRCGERGWNVDVLKSCWPIFEVRS